MYVDQGVLSTYERFLLTQYHLRVEGLYAIGGNTYCIHCPDLTSSTLSTDDFPITEWLEDNRVMGTWISLRSELPPGAFKVDQHANDVISHQTGVLFSNNDVRYELDLLVPKDYPPFELHFNGSHEVISFATELAQEQIDRLELALTSVKFPYKWKIEFNPEVKDEREENGYNPFNNTLTSRELNSQIPSQIKDAWEKDEDIWMSRRNALLGDMKIERMEITPTMLKKEKLRGLIDASYMVPYNLRNYFTLFDEVCLVAPTKERMERVMEGLKIEPSELMELVRKGKLHVLFPQSIQLYDYNLILRLLDANPQNVHFSRSITALTIFEERRRNPFFLPHLELDKKHLMVRLIKEEVENLPLREEYRKLIIGAIADVASGWLSIPNMANQNDSIQLSQVGLVSLLKQAPAFANNDGANFALTLAAPSVQWAAATKSILVPSKSDNNGYGEICYLLARFYSGMPNEELVIEKPSYANFVVNEVLTITDKVPVTELVDSFESGEISRFRKFVLKSSQNQTDIGELEELVGSFNAVVKDYEKRSDLLGAMDIKGFLVGLAKEGGLSLPKFLIKIVLNNIIKKTHSSARLSELMDTLEAMLVETYPDAVLVSRMKTKLKKRI